MDITAAVSTSRSAAYIRSQAGAAQAGKKAGTPASTHDEVVISSAAAVSEDRAAGGGSTSFTTFAAEFDKITQGYAGTIRSHYAGPHRKT